MDLANLLEIARQKEKDIALEYDIKSEEYKNKLLQNDKIRRDLKAEEDELKKLIPEQPFVEGSEWAKALEDIRVLERLIGD